jgi:hypothetical protein
MVRSDILPEVLAELSKLLDNEIVTEKEVEVKLRRALLRLTSFNLNFSSKFDFHSILERVKESLFKIPHSISSPHFPERLELDTLTFFYEHTCKPDEKKVEVALDNYRKAEKFLSVLPKLKEITDEFFKGYKLREGIVRRYSKGKYTSWVFYSTLDDLFEDLPHHLKLAETLNASYAVVVPVEKSPKNFINFYRRYSEEVKKAGLRIWVANPKNLTIDPLIGYPKDLRLLRNFRNPRVASMISSIWRAEIREID